MPEIFESLNKMYKNRFFEERNSFEEYAIELSNVQLLLKEINPNILRRYLNDVVVIFDENNLEYEIIASTEFLIFDLVNLNIIKNIELLDYLIDCVPHFRNNAKIWGEEIFQNLFHKLGIDGTINDSTISLLFMKKEAPLIVLFKSFIKDFDYEYSTKECKDFGLKCLDLLKNI
jgi:hypothetical protein